MPARNYRSLLLQLFIAVTVLSLAPLDPTLQANAQTAPGKTPLTHETMWLMKRVGAPNPSPDGKWVVFSLIEPAYDEKDQVSDLWIVPTDRSASPRRLTFSKGGESGVVWSSDSQRLAFSAKREGDEVNQIYVLDVAAGGEAVRVTSLSTGARTPVWRPDGRALVFTSTVFPGAADEEANKKIAAERKALKYRARVYDRFPIRNWDKWIEDTQGHLFIQSLEPGAKPRDLLAGTKLVAGRGFAGRVTDSGEEFDAAWTPDGEAIIFVAMTKRDAAAYATTNSALFKVSSTGGEPRQLTTGDDSFSRPVFSPDGKALYAIFNVESNAKVGSVLNLCC
jgi:Tol biopolymer transport system component